MPYHLKMLQTSTPYNRFVERTIQTLFAACVLLATTNVSWAQAPTTYITVNTSGLTIDFDTPTLWAGGSVPPDSASVTISNASVNMNVDKVLSTVTISGGGYITMGSSTLTILDQFLVNNSGGVQDDGGSSTLKLESTVASGGFVTIGGDNDATFYNIEVVSGSVVNFDAGGTGETDVYVSNQLKMGGGSVIVNPPHYTSSSTLLYDATYATVGAEWKAGASSGKGVPHHVSVGGSGSLSFADTTGNFTCTGNFTMLDASGSLDLSSMLGNLTIDGDFTTGTNGAVTVTMPSVEGKGTLSVGGNMTLNANTTWSGGEGNVEIGGDLANNITDTAFGLLKFDGSADQDITGNKITVDSLVVANTQNAATDDTDVDFQADVDIVPGGVFSPIDGTAKITGTFTMNSDATGTARIATLADNGSTSDVDGDITFERYVPAVSDGYSFLLLGNYVKDATRLMWSNSFSPAFNMVMSFDEDFAVLADGGSTAWSVISGDETTLSSDGTGYVVYTSANSSPTITTTGSYNTSAVSLIMTSSSGPNQGGGMNLITNPFPCPIDGAKLISENTLFSTYYIYDNATDNWSTYGAGAPGTIDIGQSFYVQASAGGNVNFNLTQLTHGTNSFVREIDPLEQGIVGIQIAQEDGRFGKTFVRFHENSNETFEWNFDVTHKGSGNNNNPEIFSVVDENHALHVNTPGAKDEVNLVNLTVESGSSGTVSIAMDEEFPLPEGMCGLIVDTETGESSAIGGDPLVVDLQPFTIFENRFVLEFMTTPNFSVTSNYCSGGTVHFGTEEESNLWTINWSSDTGNTGSGCITGLDAGTYEFDAIDPITQCISSAELTVAEVCMGDFNLNGERDITDLLLLLVGIQPVDNFDGSFPETDCDCDGVMTTLDLLMFLPQFGNYCD